MEFLTDSWDEKAYRKVVALLESEAEEEYREFQKSLIPGADNILGVRLPKLRTLARRISREDGRGFLRLAADDSLEEILLQGFVIGYIKAETDEKLAMIEDFVPKISNWAVCDSFCTGLKFRPDEAERFFGFLQRFLSSRDEFSLRFAVVMMMKFIDSEHIDRVLDLLSGIGHDAYYVKVAVAWAISECYVKFKDKTLNLLLSGSIDDFTYARALQKIIESKRIDEAERSFVRSLRKS